MGITPGGRADEIEGVTWAAAFELFDAGSNAADIVKALKLSSAHARFLQKEWADLRGAMVIAGETLSKIRRYHTSERNPIHSGEELLLFIQEADLPSCAVCQSQPMFCMSCYHGRPGKAEKMAKLYALEAQERQAAIMQEQLEREAYQQAQERLRYDPVATAAKRATIDARAAERRAAREKREQQQQQRPPSAAQTARPRPGPESSQSGTRVAPATATHWTGAGVDHTPANLAHPPDNTLPPIKPNPTR